MGAGAAGRATIPTTLFERERELAAVDALVGRTADGGGSVLIIEGPAGIGKTELLRAASSHAASLGLASARARGGLLERDLAHGVVRQLLEPRLDTPGKGSRAELFGGAAHLAAGVFENIGQGETPERGQHYPVLHGLYWLTSNLADRSPVVLCVDDAHLADAPSLRFLAYLARRIEGLAAGLVVALRSGEESVDEEALADLVTSPSVEVLRPKALTTVGVGFVAEAQLQVPSAPSFTAALHRATGGNPFLVRELVGALAVDRIEPDEEAAARIAELRPRTVARAVAARLARLAAPAMELARAVAILGDRAALGTAADLAGLTPDEAAEAADVLVAAQVLEASEEAPTWGLAFVHPLIRATVEEGIPSHVAAAAHARAARLLMARGAEPARVATHLIHTEPQGEALLVDVLRAAANSALVTGAPGIAVTYLRRALVERPVPGNSSLLWLLGTTEGRASLPEAPVTLARALDAAETSDELAAAALELGRALAMAGRREEGMAVLAAAMERLEDRADLVAALDVDRLLIAHFGASQRPLVLRHLKRADRRQPNPATRVALALAAVEEVMVGAAPDAAISYASQALGEGEMLALLGPATAALGAAVSSLAISGACKRARVEAGRAMVRAQDLGSAAEFVILSACRAWCSWLEGDLAEAAIDVRAALTVPVPEQVWWFSRPMAVATLVDVLLEQGKDEEAEALIIENPFSEGARQLILYDLMLMASGRLRLAQGRPAEALEHFEQAGRRNRAWGTTTSGIVSADAYASMALLALGDRRRAMVAASAELARAHRFPAPRQLGIALRAWAHTRQGDQVIEGLREAAAVLAPSEIRLEHGRALVDLGAALRRSGALGEARQHLRAGLELAIQCEAPVLAERARDEIEASGARVGREALVGATALTPSERQVTQLAAIGHTNRDIAQALFVTSTTVELHLTHAYRKLGITSRSQLGVALAPSAPPLRPEGS